MLMYPMQKHPCWAFPDPTSFFRCRQDFRTIRCYRIRFQEADSSAAFSANGVAWLLEVKGVLPTLLKAEAAISFERIYVLPYAFAAQFCWTSLAVFADCLPVFGVSNLWMATRRLFLYSESQSIHAGRQRDG